MTRQPAFDCDGFSQAQTDAHAGRCAWQGCANAGEYRAPKDRRLTDYFHFCLDHVRAYNAKWDFHAGLSAADVEAEIRRASTWERPTWKLGALGGGVRTERMHVHDPFGFTADMEFGTRRKRTSEQTADHERVNNHAGVRGLAERNSALRVLDLTAPVTLEQLKRRYKTLVKKHHPDANGGSHEAEDQMKVINQAYQTLRAALAPAG
jgi:DnaJ-domain-containing protein 1